MTFDHQEPHFNSEPLQNLGFNFQTPKTNHVHQFQTPNSAIYSTPSSFVPNQICNVQLNQQIQFHQPVNRHNFQQQQTPASLHTPLPDEPSKSRYIPQSTVRSNASNFYSHGLGIHVPGPNTAFCESPLAHFPANLRITGKANDESQESDSLALFDDFDGQQSYLSSFHNSSGTNVSYSDYGNHSDSTNSYEISTLSLQQSDTINQPTTSTSFQSSATHSAASTTVARSPPSSLPDNSTDLFNQIESQPLLNDEFLSNDPFDMIIDLDNIDSNEDTNLAIDETINSNANGNGNDTTTVENFFDDAFVAQSNEKASIFAHDTGAIAAPNLKKGLETKVITKQASNKKLNKKSSSARVSKKSSPKSIETTIFAVNSLPRKSLEKSLSFSECSKNFPIYSTNTYSFVFENGGDDYLRKTKSQANLRVLQQHYQYDHYKSHAPVAAPKVLKNMKSGLIEFQLNLDRNPKSR